ncbi:MAG: DUF2085 domain-containing protein [Thermoplasmatota archaeon]
MKGKDKVMRSNMTVEDIGHTIIDDRGRLMRMTCHGDPSRCFWVKGRPLPLCSRCITFYPFTVIGVAIALPIAMFLHPTAWTVLVTFILLELPLVVDGYTQYLGLRSSNNALRAITGALSGIGIGGAITYMIGSIFF